MAAKPVNNFTDNSITFNNYPTPLYLIINSYNRKFMKSVLTKAPVHSYVPRRNRGLYPLGLLSPQLYHRAKNFPYAVLFVPGSKI